jgi:hypothetical protein
VRSTGWWSRRTSGEARGWARFVRALCVLAALVAVPLGFAPGALAAATGRISGTVTDTSMNTTPPIVSLSHGRPMTEPVLVSSRSERARAAIVGGSQISIGQAPWQVAVEAVIPEAGGSSRFCGGSILDSAHILTAAAVPPQPSTSTGAATAPATNPESSGVSLMGSSVTVQRGWVALVKLDCAGGAGCRGKLTLTAKEAIKARGRKKRTMRTSRSGR